MKSVDYIIVGDGYAGMFFAHQLLLRKKSFRLFSEGKMAASRVSAGVVNPAVLKRFTTFWKAQEQIVALRVTLKEIEQYTGVNYLIDEPVLRIFHDEKEKELWLKKSETDSLQPFLHRDFVSSDVVKNPYGCGMVKESFRLHVAGFFEGMEAYLDQNGYLIRERFQYEDLNPLQSVYRELQYGNIIFAEGMGVTENPYFSFIPVQPNKGHQLQVTLQKNLKEPFTFKKKHFLFPLQEGTYYYGGTYDREQTHQEIDPIAVEKLKAGLTELYPDSFDIKEVKFGFRPTVADRRPIVGNHPHHMNMFVFNGMGARGILNGNFFAQELFDHIEEGKPISPEVDLKRFQKS